MAAIIITSVFVLAALFLFVPALWDHKPSHRRYGLFIIRPRPDYIAIVCSILGVWIIALALGLTLGQGCLVWLGLFIYQIKGNYK